MKRSIVHISFDKGKKYWVAKVGRTVICADTNRANLIGRGRAAMKDLELQGYPGQLIVHTKNGRIAFEYTYLNDPSSTRG